MRRFLIILVLAILAAAGGGIYYGQLPAFGPLSFPPEGIVQFGPDPGGVLPPEITVVTYNIGYASGDKNNKGNFLSKDEVEKNLQQIAATLNSLKPDLVAMQEVDFRSRRTFDIDQFRFLAQATGMPYGAYVVTWNKKYLPWPYWPPSLQYGRILSGQAILSRFPIESHRTWTLEKPKSNPFWYNWFYLERVLQGVELKLGSGQAGFWNVHLEAFDPTTRLKQAEVLAARVREDPHSLKWAAGDYNSVAVHRAGLGPEEQRDLEDEGESLQVFSRLTGMKMDPPDPSHLTMPSWAPFEKIDHIFYSPSLALIASGTVPGALASDHLPIWGKFRKTPSASVSPAGP